MAVSEQAWCCLAGPIAQAASLQLRYKQTLCQRTLYKQTTQQRTCYRQSSPLSQTLTLFCHSTATGIKLLSCLASLQRRIPLIPKLGRQATWVGVPPFAYIWAPSLQCIARCPPTHSAVGAAGNNLQLQRAARATLTLMSHSHTCPWSAVNDLPRTWIAANLNTQPWRLARHIFGPATRPFASPKAAPLVSAGCSEEQSAQGNNLGAAFLSCHPMCGFRWCC